ncbi:hypothetical protein GCM10009678_15400 [Actinomadura kijaniata]
MLPARPAHEASLLSDLPDERRDAMARGLSELLVLLEGRLGGRVG